MSKSVLTLILALAFMAIASTNARAQAARKPPASGARAFVTPKVRVVTGPLARRVGAKDIMPRWCLEF